MTITVIGHLCLDVIDHPGVSETKSYGGIFFSIAALANLLPQEDRILPVLGVGKGDYDAFIDRLKVYPNVDTSAIYKFNGPTNQVHLMYSDTNQRVECSRHIAEPILWKKIRPHLGKTDIILVNMISGFDITLETMDEIRMEVREDRVPIYLDVHSLTLGISEECIRYYRPVETWRRWLFMLHTAHVNEDEARELTKERLDEETLAKHVLALDTKVLQITRGERGATAFMDDHKHIRRLDLEAIDPADAVDPTGCGDVFASAYCAHLMRYKDIPGALRFANRVAGFKAQQLGSTAIDRLSAFRLPESQEAESAA